MLPPLTLCQLILSQGLCPGLLTYLYAPNLIFADLPYMQRVEIAKKIGTKPVDIMDDLAELDRMAAHF